MCRQFFLCEFLGKGGFARVYKTRCTDANGNINLRTPPLATKVVEKSTLVKTHQKEKMALEIEIHKSLSHENICQFYLHFVDEKRIYVVLELCECFSLMELQKRRTLVSQPELRYFMKQIFCALAYLHNIQIIHRDLKLSNILLSKSMKCKLGDFGLATRVSSNNENKRTTLCGTPNYIAPEVLNKVGHGKPADVWSSGCIMYALLIGKPPFETENLKSTYDKIKHNSYIMPTHVKNTTAGIIIKEMLRSKQSTRPTISKLLIHPFITQGFCPVSLPDSAMTTTPAFNEAQSSIYIIDDANTDNPDKVSYKLGSGCCGWTEC